MVPCSMTASVIACSIIWHTFGLENVYLGAKYVFETPAIVSELDNDPHVISKVMEASNRCQLMLLEAADSSQQTIPALCIISIQAPFTHSYQLGKGSFDKASNAVPYGQQDVRDR